jgi:hypothetical protein
MYFSRKHFKLYNNMPVYKEDEHLQEQLDKFKKMTRPGQKFTSGSEAVNRSKARQHVQTEGQSALQKGDVFRMPDTEEQLAKVMLSGIFNGTQKEPTIGVFLPVDRDGRKVYIAIWSPVFDRSVNILTKEPTDEEHPDDAEYDDVRTYPGGQPAKDFRDTPGSAYDPFVRLLGKTIRVTDKERLRCRVIDRYDDKAEKWLFKPGYQNMCSFEYVDEE